MADTRPTNELPLALARVASSIPGRVRLRLPANAAGRSAVTAAATDLAGHGDLLVARARPKAGSLIVEYDPARSDQAWARLHELGLADASAPGATRPPVADPSTRVTTAVSRLDALVARRAGHDLRTLVPLGLGMLGLRQLARGEQRLADAPWYVLAWYASETFQKHHRSRGDGNG